MTTGNTETHSDIFVYEPGVGTRLFQRIRTSAARSFAAFTFRSANKEEHFLVVANEFSVNDGEWWTWDWMWEPWEGDLRRGQGLNGGMEWGRLERVDLHTILYFERVELHTILYYNKRFLELVGKSQGVTWVSVRWQVRFGREWLYLSFLMMVSGGDRRARGKEGTRDRVKLRGGGK